MLFLQTPSLDLLVPIFFFFFVLPPHKLPEWVCRTVGPSLTAYLKPLNHNQYVTRLNLYYRYFYRCYFPRRSSELAEIVPPAFTIKILAVQVN